MQIPFDTGDIVASVVGIGLVAKGILDRVYATKQQSPSKTCALEHSDLDHKMDLVLTILNERKP